MSQAAHSPQNLRLRAPFQAFPLYINGLEEIGSIRRPGQLLDRHKWPEINVKDQ
jgi:hypothetical protein